MNIIYGHSLYYIIFPVLPRRATPPICRLGLDVNTSGALLCSKTYLGLPAGSWGVTIVDLTIRDESKLGILLRNISG